MSDFLNICNQPHPFGGFACSKKAGHDKSHYFASMWSDDEDAITNLVDHMCERSDLPRDEIEKGVRELVARRKALL